MDNPSISTDLDTTQGKFERLLDQVRLEWTRSDTLDKQTRRERIALIEDTVDALAAEVNQLAGKLTRLEKVLRVVARITDDWSIRWLICEALLESEQPGEMVLPNKDIA